MDKGAARRVATVMIGDIGEEITEIELEPLPVRNARRGACGAPASGACPGMIAPAGEGIPGFSGRDLPLAAGSVTGVRLWHLDMTSAEAVANGTAVHVDGLLTGVFGGVWRRGENVAACGGGQGSPPCHGDLVPAPGCGCGFWAYWALRYAWRCDYYWRGEVIGIIQGYGRTRIGTRGCRCGKARILGLHVRPAGPDCPPRGLTTTTLPRFSGATTACRAIRRWQRCWPPTR